MKIHNSLKTQGMHLLRWPITLNRTVHWITEPWELMLHQNIKLYNTAWNDSSKFSPYVLTFTYFIVISKLRPLKFTFFFAYGIFYLPLQKSNSRLIKTESTITGLLLETEIVMGPKQMNCLHESGQVVWRTQSEADYLWVFITMINSGKGSSGG